MTCSCDVVVLAPIEGGLICTGSVCTRAPSTLTWDRGPQPFAFSAWTLAYTSKLYVNEYGAVLRVSKGTSQ